MRAYYQSKTPEERRRIFVAGRDPDRVRRQDNERYYRMKNDPEYALRREAVYKVHNAIRDGHMVRGNCEVCGELAQGHHDDYSKPLEVRWLCRVHHVEHHCGEAF